MDIAELHEWLGISLPVSSRTDESHRYQDTLAGVLLAIGSRSFRATATLTESGTKRFDSVVFSATFATNDFLVFADRDLTIDAPSPIEIVRWGAVESIGLNSHVGARGGVASSVTLHFSGNRSSRHIERSTIRSGEGFNELVGFMRDRLR